MGFEPAIPAMNLEFGSFVDGAYFHCIGPRKGLEQHEAQSGNPATKADSLVRADHMLLPTTRAHQYQTRVS